MKNVWRKLFKKNRPLTNQHGPSVRRQFPEGISRDEQGRFILEEAKKVADLHVRTLNAQILKEQEKTKSVKKTCKCEGNGCKCKKATTAKKPASGTKAVSKAKVAKPAPAKPTPKKPKSK